MATFIEVAILFLLVVLNGLFAMSELAIVSARRGRLVAMQPDFLTAVADLWASEPLETWKQWLRWRTVSARAPFLTSDLVDENFRFYGTVMSGTE